MYGVETEALEPEGDDSSHHRVTRSEILEYYDRVWRRLEAEHDFRFVGRTMYNFDGSVDDDGGDSSSVQCSLSTLDERGEKFGDHKISVRKRVVHARYLEPDLPIFVGPKFTYDPEVVRCVPVNSLAAAAGDGTATNDTRHYVVIGAGKTGMDAVSYLSSELGVSPDDIMWVVPNEAWITARENIGSCMEFLHTCADLAKRRQKEDAATTMKELIESPDFLQEGFLDWERRGKVYRFDGDALPSKFKDATLCRNEMARILGATTRIVRRGRVSRIGDGGEMHFEDRSVEELPWPVADTIFVHCSAGAFNYSKQGGPTPPVFNGRNIVIQDVYGTPGFCFVGSILAMMECLDGKISDAEKNEMLLAPRAEKTEVAPSPLGPSGGDIGVLSEDHGYVQRVANLRRWLRVPEIRRWLVGHRLFNLGRYSAEDMDSMVEEIWEVLVEGGLVV